MKKREIPKFKITKSAFLDMVNYCGTRLAETGGFLFGYEHDQVIRKFVADKTAITDDMHYSIDAKAMNQVIRQEWTLRQMELKGIVHTHKPQIPQLSGPDKKYFNELKTYVRRDVLFAPLVFTIPDGGLNFFAFGFFNDSDEPVALDFRVVEDDYYEKIKDAKPLEEKPRKKKESAWVRKQKEALAKPNPEVVINLIQHDPVLNGKKNSSLELTLLVGAIAVMYSAVFFGALYGLPFLFHYVSKLIAP